MSILGTIGHDLGGAFNALRGKDIRPAFQSNPSNILSPMLPAGPKPSLGDSLLGHIGSVFGAGSSAPGTPDEGGFRNRLAWALAPKEMMQRQKQDIEQEHEKGMENYQNFLEGKGPGEEALNTARIAELGAEANKANRPSVIPLNLEEAATWVNQVPGRELADYPAYLAGLKYHPPVSLGQQEGNLAQSLVGTPNPVTGQPYTQDEAVTHVATISHAGKMPVLKTAVIGGKNMMVRENPDGTLDLAHPVGEAPMTFGQTGLYVPITGNVNGKIAPVAFNERTSGVTPINMPGGGKVIPKEVQSQLNKPIAAAVGANTRYRVMLDNEQPAMQGNQQAMLNILANHIGMTMGMQQGAKITQAVWNEAQGTLPLLQKIQAKFSDKGYLSGVTLSPQQIKQMVDLGYDRRVREWQQVGDIAQQYGVDLSGQIPVDVQRSLAGLSGISARSAIGPAPLGTQVGTVNKPDGTYKMNGKSYTVHDGKVYAQ